MTLGRRFALAVAVPVLAVAFGAAIPPVRRQALRTAGGLLILSDPVTTADVVVITPESGLAGAIHASDLYHQRIVRAIAALVAEKTSFDIELARRGVRFPSITDVLVQLGVDRVAVSEISAGEGSTAASAAALGAWVRQHPGKKLIVSVGATHSRRFHRVLQRVWPRTEPMPAIVVSPYGLFQKDDWWHTRRRLADGLVELQKLGLDYLRHPF